MDLGGRMLRLTATGTRSNVLNVYVDDAGMHADRGDVLRVLEQKGHAVQRVRCGKAYTHSSEEWYSVASAASRPILLLRGTRCDTLACPKGEERYVVSLSGRLRPAKAGEVDVSGGACPGR
jgi:hypothetical protein